MSHGGLDFSVFEWPPAYRHLILNMSMAVGFIHAHLTPTHGKSKLAAKVAFNREEPSEKRPWAGRVSSAKINRAKH